MPATPLPGETPSTGNRRALVLAVLAAGLVAVGPAGRGAASGQETVAAVPLTQGEAVSLALAHNPTLEAARHQMNAVLINVERGRPRFFPEVNATASQFAQTPRVDLPGKRDKVVLPNFPQKFAVEVRQPVYQFGAGNAAEQRVEAMAAAARSEYRKAELDTVLQAREAYLAVLRAEAMAEVARRGVELARENVRLTSLLIERGLQANVDLLEAERSLAEAEAGLIQARNGVALALANLNRVTGRPIEAPVAVGEEGALPPAPPSLPELTERARGLRPELVALRHNIEAAEAGIRLAKAARLPRVNFEAAYALQTETALVPSQGFAAGLSLTFPLFDGAVHRYTVREAEERLKQLRSAEEALLQGIQLEIKQQLLAMESARGRVQAAERGVALAEKAFEIKRLQLERGRALQVELLQARQTLQQALADLAAAASDLRLAQARLERAVGEGPTAPGPENS